MSSYRHLTKALGTTAIQLSAGFDRIARDTDLLRLKGIKATTHSEHSTLLLNIINQCRGTAGATSHDAPKIINHARQLVSAFSAEMSSPFAEINAIKMAYQYITAVYLQKSLKQIHDTVTDKDFAASAQNNRPKNPNQQLIDELKSGFTDHGFAVVDLSFSSKAPNTATQLKEECVHYIDALNKFITIKCSDLIGKPIEQLDVEISRNVLDYIFGIESHPPPTPPLLR